MAIIMVMIVKGENANPQTVKWPHSVRGEIQVRAFSGRHSPASDCQAGHVVNGSDG